MLNLKIASSSNFFVVLSIVRVHALSVEFCVGNRTKLGSVIIYLNLMTLH